MRLTFERGTIAIEGNESTVPHTTWDEQTDTNRTLGFRYRDIKNHLDASDIEYEDDVLDLIQSPELTTEIELRGYQQQALNRWLSERRGVVVLPTGAGKTYVGIEAIAETNHSAFVIVPTLDLVDQWKSELEMFNVPIGEYTGREKTLKPITISTYDSAYNHAEKLGNRFKLLVFDEVHHLASESYRQIAQLFAAPFALGLTATFEREDDKHEVLGELLGGKIYEIETAELTGEYLSEYTVERITVELTPKEREMYDENVETFRNYLISTDITMRGPEDFQKVVLRSGNDPRAWRAVRSRNEARQIAYSSESKLDELAILLEQHRDDRIIIFTRYNDLVYDVSNRFFIPSITYTTDKDERQHILKRFRNHTYDAIVSSQVLNEGIDVPDANIGVILSGTGSSREYRQRLGRILRPSGDTAHLYEIVSSGTGEIRTSTRRKS
ncbi:DEAD/DEAH box helicase family protein [Haloquadratum walsbyi]|uniref:DNA or RNA helicase of superfamily II n=1 Tax=Haloquadratum walsbyi J07HQW2 TaxID=1238425 RepID=U1PM85_9EURY|nr:DEAD/DEAH box helicase family protein [Haloquadratum walsbyi]ERG94822.1 MAG: DNA or RNA helicase of superfamily II [Haloquadratum walsbyi J07HQW2]